MSDVVKTHCVEVKVGTVQAHREKRFSKLRATGGDNDGIFAKEVHTDRRRKCGGSSSVSGWS
jgi:hypothetical protein